MTPGTFTSTLLHLLILTCCVTSGFGQTPVAVRGADGGVASLQCDHDARPGEIRAIKWTKGREIIYFMALDGVVTPPGPDYAGRVTIIDQINLRIERLTLDDIGEYTCTVTVGNSEGLAIVDLDVLVLPSRPVLTAYLNGAAVNLGTTSLPLQAELVLECTSTGGKPPAELAWYRDDVRVDSSLYTYNSTADPDTNIGDAVSRLTRLVSLDDHLAKYECESSGPIPPLETQRSVGVLIRLSIYDTTLPPPTTRRPTTEAIPNVIGPQEAPESRLGTPSIIGIIVGVIAAVALIAAIIVILVQNRKRQNKNHTYTVNPDKPAQDGELGREPDGYRNATFDHAAPPTGTAPPPYTDDLRRSHLWGSEDELSINQFCQPDTSSILQFPADFYQDQLPKIPHPEETDI
ncbi:PREDICTED: leucine-rich repeats and immunoglobulin-like domains protein 3 [Branchiostoma belcheri]|uniref:Leucine-rich repeats and immunoglobulin-like domains protein 3 n=1 Tax=Branchiostoma belcheri TaxID=7741 RepID=A0A6P4YEJ2_BRABE|nr:PREDICTED: leucine-rich repeats and immunoglobulin-like domains protein 3 [Branchiostoma belcheri]